MPLKYTYLTSKQFVKKWSKLDANIKTLTTEKVDLFLYNPYHPTLKIHKLSGKLKDYWSFSIRYNLRVIFKFGKQNIVEFVDIGTHEIYR